MQSPLASETKNILNEGWNIGKMMKDKNLLLICSNQFQPNQYEEVISLAEQKVGEFMESRSLQKRLFRVMVECVQNISRHQDKPDFGDNGKSELDVSSVLIIGREDKSFFILTGNPIKQDKVKKVKDRIDEVNGLDDDELKNMFRETMQDSDDHPGGGANLGFIDMARKSALPLQYNFKPLDEDYSFFTFKVNVAV